MRRTLSTAVLILAFSCPVAAGVIHNPPPEPSPLLQEVVRETAEGERVGVKTAPPGWSDTLPELTFDLLAILPTLLF